MKRLLIEVGVEEIPARFLESNKEKFKKDFIEYLDNNRIDYKEAIFYATPRRLVFIAERVNEKQKQLEVEIQGPPKNIAFDNKGNPTKALESFLKKNSLTLEDLSEKETNKGIYIVAKKILSQDDIKDVVSKTFSSFIKERLIFPKTMRWTTKKISFVRPIRWILALFGEELIHINFEDIVVSDKYSYSVRFLGNKKILIDRAENFEKILEQNNVIVDHNRRFTKIKDSIEKIADKFNSYYSPSDLIWENVFLTEYANVDYNKIDDKFLELPDQVLTNSIAINQKYFTLFSKDDNKLLGYYIFVYDLNEKYVNNVKKGTEKVIKARLNDALFFYNEDLKVPLISLKEKLKGVLFEKTLGSMYEKVERTKELYQKNLYLLDSYLTEDEKENIIRVFDLYKNDLVTNMVSEKEFTDLQGYMGKIYALKQGEKKNVAYAIEEHYFPRYSGDILPTTKEGLIVGFFDKIDTIVGFFIINKLPSGSKDPYSLRRHSLGIIRYIIEKELDISLNKIFEISIQHYMEKGFKLIHKKKELTLEEMKDKIREFFAIRLDSYLQEKGYSYDLIDVIKDKFFDEPILSMKIIDLLKDFKSKKEFEKLIYSYKRLKNILEKSKLDLNSLSFDLNLLKEEKEKKLYEVYKTIERDIANKINNKDIKGTIESLLLFSQPLEDYFNNVMVMVNDEKLKINRLATLKLIKDLFEYLGKLENIVYEKT